MSERGLGDSQTIPLVVDARSAGREPIASARPRPVEAARDALRVLLVDDEPLILRAYARAMRRSGLVFVTVDSGESALAALEQGGFDVVVADIHMPGISGVDLLAGIRRRDPDVPVILVTGSPSLETATQAVELGAHRYLSKPVAEAELIGATVSAGRSARLNRLKRLRQGPRSDGQRIDDLEGLASRFDVALECLWLAFQPIVSWREQRIVAYEALCRSDDPLFRSPLELLDAAERLGRIHDFGRTIRARAAARMDQVPDGCPLFLNAHPHELTDPELLDPGAPLAQHAGRVVLEVTERRALHGMDATALASGLREFGYRLAVDDLGAGYAGLSSLAQLAPTVAKLDMSLIRGVDREPLRQRIVHGMVRMCTELGVLVVVEGVETAAERDALIACDCDWMQGYLFGRPAREFASWPAP